MFEKLYEECLALLVKAEMQDEEDTRKDVAKMIDRITFAWVEDLISKEENDTLVDLLK